nr:hypothetical protein [Tanacetum cinerariifolium]
MSTPNFVETHNLVAFLEKATESEGFEQIIDFLNANPIKYVLTVNPMIYTSCIKQFWATEKVKIVNGENHIQALVDKKKVIITETSVRSDLHLEDDEGTECLPTATTFKQLTLIGPFFNALVLRLLLGTNLVALWPRLSSGKDFSGKVTPLFENMKVQPQEDMGEDSKTPTDSHHTPIFNQPSTSSQPQQKHKSKKSKKRITKVSQLSDSTHDIADEHATATFNVPLLSGNLEDASKQGRMIEDLDANEGVALGRNDQDMFDTSILDDDEVVAEKEVTTADPVTTAGEVVTIAGVEILPKEVSNFALPVIKKMIQESLNHVNLGKASSQPQSSYEVAATLTEFELKKILIDKISSSESYLTAPEHQKCYDGLIKSYNLDKDLFSSYDVYLFKRSRDNKDKDEGPSVGSDG